MYILCYFFEIQPLFCISSYHQELQATLLTIDILDGALVKRSAASKGAPVMRPMSASSGMHMKDSWKPELFRLNCEYDFCLPLSFDLYNEQRDLVMASLK